MFTWLSLEGSFTDNNSSYQANGWRIRWDRMFKATNTGEANKTSYWWVAAILMGIFFGWDYIMKFVKRKKNGDRSKVGCEKASENVVIDACLMAKKKNVASFM